MAAREFGAQPDAWQLERPKLLTEGWMEEHDLGWQPENYSADGPDRAFEYIRSEIEQLQMLMQDDRARYLDESDLQADGIADYFNFFIGAHQARYPWTLELVNTALALGNVAYMFYKQEFSRVRPSFLCPGLVPPFGPPAHPSFPSGHAFLGHLIALFLLEIPGIAHRYGIFPATDQSPDGSPGRKPTKADLEKRDAINSPLLWLSQRVAKNRERIGVHYPSDSMGSRHLAAGIWWALLREDKPTKPQIDCPTLHTVIERAKAEWPTEWPAT